MMVTQKKKQHFTVQKKLEVLELAEKLGSITKACNDKKIDRSTFYKWQKQFQAGNLSGLERKPKSVSTDVFRIKADISEQVLDFSLVRPEWGCDRVALALKKEGINISSPTVQRILLNAELGSVSQRLFRLEEKHFREGLEISPHQLELIKKNNPVLREYKKTGIYPGEVLVQDTFPIFDLLPNTYIHVVIDTYSTYAFALPSTEKSASKAKDLLNTVVLKHLSERGLEVRKIITGRGYEFTRQARKYTKHLNTLEIIHEVYSGNERNWNGFIERYKQKFYLHFSSSIKESTDLLSQSKVIQRIKNNGLNTIKYAAGYPTFGLNPVELIDRNIKKYSV
jgi:transposase-like protein